MPFRSSITISTPCDCDAHIVPKVEVELYPDGQMRLAPMLGGVTMTEVMEAMIPRHVAMGRSVYCVPMAAN